MSISSCGSDVLPGVSLSRFLVSFGAVRDLARKGHDLVEGKALVTSGCETAHGASALVLWLVMVVVIVDGLDDAQFFLVGGEWLPARAFAGVRACLGERACTLPIMQQ